MDHRIDPAAYGESLDRLAEQLRGIVATADEQAKRRCPYRNRLDECTAAFGCRNRQRGERSGGLPGCRGDDRLDYRSAWETS